MSCSLVLSASTAVQSRTRIPHTQDNASNGARLDAVLTFLRLVPLFNAGTASAEQRAKTTQW